jgi:cytosine/adenosine deaminase-related metal-dependent hydrolase
MIDLVIHNYHALIPSDNLPPSIQKNCDILIDRGNISDIRMTGLTAVAEAREIIEADEIVAIPGLINTLAH